MGTGAHTQWDKGQMPAWVVAVMLGLGVACIVVLGVALHRAGSLWRSHRTGALLWFGRALPLWLFWALWRVMEASS